MLSWTGTPDDDRTVGLVEVHAVFSKSRSFYRPPIPGRRNLLMNTAGNTVSDRLSALT